jgi:hypothetical protein
MENRRKYVKICFNGKVKRIALICDFESFREEAENLFNQEFKDEEYEFLYLDDEDDIIQLESQADYDQALMYLFNTNYVKSLKVRIIPKYKEFEYNKELPNLYLDSVYDKKLNELSYEIEKLEKEEERDRLMCSRCTRCFNPESYYKHIKVCWRVFQTKRIPFNSRRKRLTREQLLHAIIHQQDKQIENIERKENQWREQSQEFRRRIRELRKRADRQRDQRDEIKIIDQAADANKERKRVHLSQRKPFNSKQQRLKEYGEVRSANYEKVQNRWKLLSQKFRTVVKLSKMLRI